MAQLSLFNASDLASMRDRTSSRTYSPERDAFRLDHERRRDHGKARRHAERIYRDFQKTCDSEVPRIPARSPGSIRPQEQHIDRKH